MPNLLESWTTLKAKIKSKNKQLIQTQLELSKEKGWWDKWINDENDNLSDFSQKVYTKQSQELLRKRKEEKRDFNLQLCWSYSDDGFWNTPSSILSLLAKPDQPTKKVELQKTKQLVKCLYEYYQNQKN